MQRKQLSLHLLAGKSAHKLRVSHLILRSIFGIDNAISPRQKQRLVKYLSARGFADLEEQNRIAKAIYNKYRTVSPGISIPAGAERAKEAADLIND